MILKLEEIIVTDHIRKDNGDIQKLAESIQTHGLLSAITVMNGKTGFVLIAGYRRYSAMKMLGKIFIEATLVDPGDAEAQLRMEYEENECRKEFTVSEKVEYAEKLRAIEEAKARQRKSIHARDGYQDCPRGDYPDDETEDDEFEEEDEQEESLTPPEMGRTNEILAKKSGFSSRQQLDRATYLLKNRPDLLEKVDCGEKSLTRAYEEAKGIDRKNPPQLSSIGQINGKLGHTGEPFVRPDGFPYIFSEINSAGEFFLREIEMTMSHYDPYMQSENNDKDLSQALLTIFMRAANLMDVHYKGPRFTTQQTKNIEQEEST